MTSSLLASGAPSDEKTKSHEEASSVPLFQIALGLYDRTAHLNAWTLP
jgi:hypothetical protein